jgi:hypothetical protein
LYTKNSCNSLIRESANLLPWGILKEAVRPDFDHGVQERADLEALPCRFKDEIGAAYHAVHVAPWFSWLG